jgi:uncharacterized protein (TIGR02996 family)
VSNPKSAVPAGSPRESERLESWKEIAAYLQRDIRTLHRWELHEGLPIHRHVHRSRGSVYAFRRELDEWREGRRASGGVAAQLAVMLAVLPFENLSGTPAEDYFSDGFTEDVITHLGRLRGKGLGVIARTSMMRYKATRKSIREVARELRVDYVLEGSVRRAADRVRVTAQLIQVADQTHLWAESYDRDARDILWVQDDIARAVATRTGAMLTRRSDTAHDAAAAVNPQAFDAYLKGQSHWYKLSRHHLDTAFEYFELALTHDPQYALAYEGIARVWLMRSDAGWLPPSDTVAKAKAAALKAIELDDELGAVHVTVANIKFCNEWDWQGAEAEFRRAIELNPNSAEARLFYADFLMSIGRPEHAAAEMARALELDPFNFFIRCFHGWHLVYRGACDAALEPLQAAVRDEPHFSSAHLGLWGAFYATRRFDQALAAAAAFFSSIGDDETCRDLVGSGEPGYRAAMARAAQRLARQSAGAHVAATRVSRLYAHASDVDCAFEWLERAYARRESPLVHLNVGWDWVTLRRDARFRDLLRRIGFPRVASR